MLEEVFLKSGRTRLRSQLCCAVAIMMVAAYSGLRGSVRRSSRVQAGSMPLSFDVALIKPSNPSAKGGAGSIRVMPGGQTYVAQGVSLKLLVMTAYRLNEMQVSGGPNWLYSDLWDIQAKAGKSSSSDELREMLKTLLAERFALRFHNETRDMRVYVLTVDEGGTMVKEDKGPETYEPTLHSERGERGQAKEVANRETMAHFAWWLSSLLAQPVVDRTGLAGLYDFTLEWPIGDVVDAKKAADDAQSKGFSLPAVDDHELGKALRRELGLKLEKGRGPVLVMAIDHAERASTN
jgi:uncharacterized protein (TIGR03435 family)